MNREIKFRFWTPDKRMVEDHDGWTEGIGINEALNCSREYGYVAMQFTGLLDNERQQIYDKDILRVFYDGKEFYCLVEWNQQMAGWCLRMSDPKIYLEINALAMSGDENGIVLTSAFVAGNDFQHPHLLTP